MIRFLTTHGIASEIERVITDARKSLVLVTPYLKVSNILFERLTDAERRGVSATLIYDEDEHLIFDPTETKRET